MTLEFIEPIPAEAENLALHTQLCAARYQQITQSFEVIDARLIGIEVTLREIQLTVTANQNNLLNRFISWSGVIIGILASVTGYLVVHYVLK